MLENVEEVSREAVSRRVACGCVKLRIGGRPGPQVREYVRQSPLTLLSRDVVQGNNNISKLTGSQSNLQIAFFYC